MSYYNGPQGERNSWKKHFGNLKMRFVLYSRAIIYESIRSQESGPVDSITVQLVSLGDKEALDSKYFLYTLGIGISRLINFFSGQLVGRIVSTKLDAKTHVGVKCSFYSHEFMILLVP